MSLTYQYHATVIENTKKYNRHNYLLPDYNSVQKHFPLKFNFY